jgi:DNA repair exonuclease SbcCD ATPase subunit
MYIKSVTISNVLSIENATVSFSDSGLLLIDGWNHDTESANGAGKSAIFHALSWGIYGQYPRGVSITDFVRQGSRATKVTADIELSKDRLLRVERSRPKSFYASLNGVEIAEAEYERLIPLDYDQFILAQYFAQGLGLRFIDLNDSGRKDLILKLMRADGFAESRKKIESDTKRYLSDKVAISSTISTLTGKLSAYRDSLVDSKLLQTEISALERAINDVNIKMQKLSNVQPPDDTDKLSELIDKLNSKLRDISLSNGKLKAYRQQLSDLKNIKEPEDSCDGECPSCSTELNILPSGFVKHDRQSFVLKIKAHRESMSAKIDALTSSIISLETEVSKERSILDAISSLKSKMRDSMFDYEAAQSRLSELKAFRREKEIEHKNLLKTHDQQNDLLIKINQLQDQLSENKSNLDSITNEIVRFEAASAILSPTGAPAYVMDSVIQTLNDKIQEIVQLVWPNSAYELLSFKENKSGTVTSKMSDSLTVDGVKRSVGSLSGGERRCLSLAIDFAIADVVARYTGAQLNPLILDEPFDHLDASNRIRVIDFLREMAIKRCIVVIDHASEAKALFDHSITVTKKNGISVVS